MLWQLLVSVYEKLGGLPLGPLAPCTVVPCLIDADGCEVPIPPWVRVKLSMLVGVGK